MALVHDVAEAIVGDITPSCGVSKEDKRRMESDAMDEICRTLGEGAPAGEERYCMTHVSAHTGPHCILQKSPGSRCGRN